MTKLEKKLEEYIQMVYGNSNATEEQKREFRRSFLSGGLVTINILMEQAENDNVDIMALYKEIGDKLEKFLEQDALEILGVRNESKPN